jgi:hypothetical protein
MTLHFLAQASLKVWIAGALLGFAASCSAPESKIDGDIIDTSSEVNREVAKIILAHTRERLRSKFCFDESIHFRVVDMGATADDSAAEKPRPGFIDIQMPWLFESDARRESDPDNSAKYLVEHFTRPGSANYVLAHEIGHLWLQQYRERSLPDPARYSTTAPDWLDEAIAIQFEDAGRHMLRKQQFNDSFVNDEIFELSFFLQMSHPKHSPNQVGTFLEPATGLKRERPLRPKDVNLFYTQSLAVSEFLLEKSQNPCLLSVLFERHANGGAAQSIVLEAPVTGHPEELESLQQEFTQWIVMSAHSNAIDEGDNG